MGEGLVWTMKIKAKYEEELTGSTDSGEYEKQEKEI